MHSNLLTRTAGLLLLLALFLTVDPALAQRDNSKVRPSPNAKVSQTIGTTEVDLHYSRPSVKGRPIFGGLEKWDKPWRAGANEPTTITFSKDVMIEGQALAAGSYALWITPKEQGDWDVILSTVPGWGTQYNEDNNVLTVQVTPKQGAHQEQLIYTFNDLSATGTTLTMHWAETMVPINISIDG